jgi:hypothetical protein
MQANALYQSRYQPALFALEIMLIFLQKFPTTPTPNNPPFSGSEMSPTIEFGQAWSEK